MSYTVFARKYRPQTFDQIVGQEHIVKTLKNAIAQNRLAQAYLFVGPRGTGKTSTARIFAKALNCTDGPKADFDPNDPICLEIAEGRSMNVLEFDAASNTQVDKIREIIIDNAKYAPTGAAKYKVYIVDEVHMLSTASFNALLKTLEEPPAHVKFVFATTDVQKVPTTIISRCQRFDLKRIPTPQIRDHLLMIAGNENVALSAEAAEAVARGAEGGLRDAESMLDQLVAFCGDKIGEEDVLNIFGFTARQVVAELCGYLIDGDTPAALRTIYAQAEAGKDLSRLMSDLIEYLRNLLVARSAPEGLHDELSAETVETLTAQAAQLSADKLLGLIEQFADAESRMKWAANKKMHFEIALIRAIQTLSQATLTEVIDALIALRGGGPLPEVAARPVKPASTLKPPAAPAAKSAPAPTPAVAAPKSAPAPEPEPPKAVAAPTPPPWVETSEKPTAPEEPPAPPAEAPPTKRLSLSETVAASLGTTAKPSNRASAAPAVKAPEAPVQKAAPTTPIAPPPASSATTSSAESIALADQLWPQLVARVRKDRPLISAWVDAGKLVEVGNGVAILGFPPSASLSQDTCDRPNNRSFLENAISEIAGQALTLKCEKRDGLVFEPIPREDAKPAAAVDPMIEFKNDPLIQKALAEFKAEILPA